LAQRALALAAALFSAREAAFYLGSPPAEQGRRFVLAALAGDGRAEGEPHASFPASFTAAALSPGLRLRLESGEAVRLRKTASGIPGIPVPLLLVPVGDGEGMGLLLLSGPRLKGLRKERGTFLEMLRLFFLAEAGAGREGEARERGQRSRRARNRELKLYHEDRLTALGTLAAGIAHELNQPLNTIRVVTEGLLFGREEGWPLDIEEMYENMGMISRQVLRMDKVIQGVRNFAREDGGQGLENVNANEAIENVFSIIGRQIEAHGIRVEKDLDPELPPLRANLNELEQVMMNLIVNARQALNESLRESKTLAVRTEGRDGRVLIEVSDNGAGVPEHLREKIFDPFFTTKGVGKGTGLGLSICQSLVGKFGGRIEACGRPGGGATFRITAGASGGVG
jgi:signal transduction histidine kinase